MTDCGISINRKPRSVREAGDNRHVLSLHFVRPAVKICDVIDTDPSSVSVAEAEPLERERFRVIFVFFRTAPFLLNKLVIHDIGKLLEKTWLHSGC